MLFAAPASMQSFTIIGLVSKLASSPVLNAEEPIGHAALHFATLANVGIGEKVAGDALMESNYVLPAVEFNALDVVMPVTPASCTLKISVGQEFQDSKTLTSIHSSSGKKF